MAEPDRVLLVDDDPLHRDVEVRRLTALGYDCVAARDGFEAADVLRAQDFDAVVTDVHMPGNEDLSFVKAVQDIRPGMPVIIITGQPSMQTAAASIGLGVRAYLLKPYTREQLVSELQAAVRVRRLQRALSDARQRLDDSAARMAEAEMLLAARAGSDQAQTAYVEVQLWQVVATTAELCRFLAANPADPTAPPPSEITAAVSLGDMVDALRTTVDVLDRTRDSFKSKDLGQLRRRVEELLCKLSVGGRSSVD
ncbi:MAG: response regulator [Armatimonadetes bacterium]|nr:response regulator [Armatimonadota bacterium]